jgi:hypothetical protein
MAKAASPRSSMRRGGRPAAFLDRLIAFTRRGRAPRRRRLAAVLGPDDRGLRAALQSRATGRRVLVAELGEAR